VVRNFDFRRYAPVLLIALLVVTPLAIWAATSGGSSDKKDKLFYVERAVGLTGGPELLITVDDPSVEVTSGADNVEVLCTDAKSKVIVRSTQLWPFPLEQGYPPHAHVAAAPEKVELARKCAVTGTNKKLSAPVQ
jgi:hypothetical protein